MYSRELQHDEVWPVARLPDCVQFDANHDELLSIDELIQAVNGSLVGCVPLGYPQYAMCCTVQLPHLRTAGHVARIDRVSERRGEGAA